MSVSRFRLTACFTFCCAMLGPALPGRRRPPIKSEGFTLSRSPPRQVYPISSFTWIVVPARSADDAKRNALTGFLQWMVGPGQRQAAALGYLPLPKDVVNIEEAAIARIH
jgi:hypothetical protein